MEAFSGLLKRMSGCGLNGIEWRVTPNPWGVTESALPLEGKNERS
jgi:hypothetical protein